MKAIASAIILAVAASTGAKASVTINLGIGEIFSDEAATTLAPAGALINVLAKTDGTSWGSDLDIYNLFQPLTDSFIPVGDYALVQSFGSDDGAGPGTTFTPVNYSYSGALTAGDQLLMVIYPTLTTADASPGLGTLGLFYRTDLLLNGSDIAWVAPSDGFTVNLFATTGAVGGTLAANAFAPGDANAPGIPGGGGHGFTTAPEPSPSAGGSFTARAPGGVRFITSSEVPDQITTTDTDPPLGVYLAPNATSWQTLSDRQAKSVPTAVNHRQVLGQVDAMPVSSWQYKHDPGRRYIGPMAQDFHAAFGLGYDDRHISTLDTDGVALSALKGLIAELQLRQDRSAAQDVRLRALESELEGLRQRIAAE